MSEIKKHELLELMDDFMLNGWDIPYFCVEVFNDEIDDYEYIVNPLSSLSYKRKYYDKAYDDDLRLKANNSIHIEDGYPLSVIRRKL